jgi:hypothetical protein
MSRVSFATRSLDRVEGGRDLGGVRILRAPVVAARRGCTPVRDSTPMATRYPLLLRLGLTSVMAAAFCTPVDGQVVRGTVSEVDTGTPVAYARLLLLDEGYRPVGSFVSDEVGRFEFAVPPGLERFSVYADGIAHKSFVEGPFTSGPDTIALAFALGVQPLPIDPVEVLTEARSRRLTITGFYKRRTDQPGAAFLERADVEKKKAFRASGVFRRIAGVHVVPLRNGMDDWQVLLRNRCLPSLWIDGVNVRSLGGANGLPVRIDDLVQPAEIEGIEIYRSAGQVPARYGGTGASCGVILIWTR